MSHQLPLPAAARADHPPEGHHALGLHELTPDLAYQRLALVNVAFIGPARTSDWILVDAGIPGMAGLILRAARARYGNAPPAAIWLTHGHFDHVGSVDVLAHRWRVPVYIHELEMPYVNGTASYPPPDPSVGGGLMSAMAKLYPRGPINISRFLRPLPSDHSMPLPHWHWIHTPGHTPGQVAFFRPADRALLAADAFITTSQESAYAVAFQTLELHGPPMYYTQDSRPARESVQYLASLTPNLALTGHGRPIQGINLRHSLHTLATHFDQLAIPPHGHYLSHPARIEDHSAYATPRR